MNDVDITAHAARIRDHRFTGYTNAMLADEIDLMRSGQGVAGISDAVAALKAVARALEETDDTLRRQLTELGVEWDSDAGREAASVVHSGADFSREAGEKVSDSAERVFAQGEAYNRAVHSLPDPAILRAPRPEPGFTDFAFSLLGFESDHVRQLERSLEAREQAVQALDTYAKQSGENLVGVPELGEPERLVAKVPERVPTSIDAGGGPGDTTSAASVPAAPASAPGTSAPPAPSPTSAPSAPSAPGSSAPSSAGVVMPSSVATPTSDASARPASGSGALVGAKAGPVPSGPTGAAPPGPTSPGTTPPQAGAGVPPVAAAGVAGAAGVGRGEDLARAQKGAGAAGVPTTSTDAESSRATRAGGGTPGPGGAPLSGAGSTTKSMSPASEQQLAPGLASGAVAPDPDSVPDLGTGAAPAPEGNSSSLNAVGGGIAALGAGGVAGALAGQERSGRGVGRSAPGAQISPRPLAVGDLPEEEAKVQRSSERLNPGATPRKEAFLEKAVPGEEEDGEQVRRFAVEDEDLFTDQRMVAPDVIGDDGSDGRL
ncbi:PPE domain-containing protein [Saccharomonospora azurea]|uniref:PPE domain-containing protein n=3 Tax=Saccharomonospora azurea TaxID=40988 RepID=UPI00332677D4